MQFKSVHRSIVLICKMMIGLLKCLHCPIIITFNLKRSTSKLNVVDPDTYCKMMLYFFIII